MHHLVRNLLFAVFVAAFVVGAPVVVLYTAGYRYNPVNGLVVRTGVLSVESDPRGAAIALSGETTGEKTPYIFNRVMPGDYTVALSREGYHTWEREVAVASGGTTYLSDVVMFLDEAPALAAALPEASLAVPSADGRTIALVDRTERSARIWLFDPDGSSQLDMITEYPARASDMVSLTWNVDATRLTLHNTTQGTAATFTTDGILLADDVQTDAAAPVALVANAQAVEVYDVREGRTLVALLPLTEYRIAEAEDGTAVIVGANHAIYVIDLDDADNPIVVSANGTAYDFDAAARRFVWTDGIELNAADLDTGERTFITRQSNAIIAVAWYPESNTVLVATNDDLRAFSLNDGGTTITSLLGDATMFSFSLTEHAESASFYGEYDGVRGVFILPLTK